MCCGRQSSCWCERSARLFTRGAYLALVVWVRSEEVRNEFCGFVRSHVSTLAALPGSQWPCSLIPRSRSRARAPGCTRSPSFPPTPPPGGASETPGDLPCAKIAAKEERKEGPGKERVQWTWWSCRGISSGAPLGGRVLTLVFKWPTLQFESARGRGQLQFLALLLWDDPNTVHFNFVMVGSR